MRNYEFKIVASSFNDMSSELKRLFEYVYKVDLALKDAKILALQSQIDHHFLGNTLEMMNLQARSYEAIRLDFITSSDHQV